MTTSVDASRSPDDLPALVAASLAGDQSAWNNLVRRLSPLVSSVSRRYRLSETDIDDVGQNVWLSLLEHLKDIREPRALPGWIVTTTKNESLRILSAHRRIVPVDPQVDTRLDRVEQVEPDANLLRMERYRAVHSGLGELRPEQRELLSLFLTDQAMSYRQIGRELGIPVGSIGPTRARGLERLQATMAVQALAS